MYALHHRSPVIDLGGFQLLESVSKFSRRISKLPKTRMVCEVRRLPFGTASVEALLCVCQVVLSLISFHVSSESDIQAYISPFFMNHESFKINQWPKPLSSWPEEQQISFNQTQQAFCEPGFRKPYSYWFQRRERKKKQTRGKAATKDLFSIWKPNQDKLRSAHTQEPA